MNLTSTKNVGWLLISAGVLVAVFSERIVFPALERLVGIETIVGHDNVVYQPDGGYLFTNPAAMVRWVSVMRAIGVLICLFGGWLVVRARGVRPKSSDENVDEHAA